MLKNINTFKYFNVLTSFKSNEFIRVCIVFACVKVS